MSLENNIKHNCPHCETEQTLRLYNSVNITIDPSLKNKVLNGKLNSQSCSNCNKEINIMTGFLYHDMENQLMINFKQDIDVDELSKFEVLKDLKDKGYIYRDVNTYPGLIEKIKIFDSKMNDEIIEKIKSELLVMLSVSLKEVIGDTEDSEINIFYDQLEKGLFNKKLSFIFFLHPSQIMKIDYNLKKLSSDDRNQLFNLENLRKQNASS